MSFLNSLRRGVGTFLQRGGAITKKIADTTGVIARKFGSVGTAIRPAVDTIATALAPLPVVGAAATAAKTVFDKAVEYAPRVAAGAEKVSSIAGAVSTVGGMIRGKD